MENKADPFTVFSRLRQKNPSPLAGTLIMGTSRSSFAHRSDTKTKKRIVETRPIKETRKRGETPEECLLFAMI